MTDASQPDDDALPPPTAEIVKTLVANHRAFLAFVQRRVGDRDTAEEIVQNAFVKSIDKLDTIQDTAIGWFYQVLRNALIDHQRRQAVANKHIDRVAQEADVKDPRDEELHGVACQCVSQLATTLKPEYADALQQIELQGLSVKDYAAQLGISSSNAGVRVFRARQALRRQVMRSCGTCATHGCLDCTCGA